MEGNHQHARQESNELAVQAGKPQVTTVGDARSDALSGTCPSPAVSLLAKLVTGLTADERSALSQMLRLSDGGNSYLRTRPTSVLGFWGDWLGYLLQIHFGQRLLRRYDVEVVVDNPVKEWRYFGHWPSER